jgi:hypothetical protein
MAKSRKSGARRALRGGLGDQPAGRSSFADMLRTNARAISEDDLLPPIPENRAVETFQTVGEDLRKQMMQNPRDPARQSALKDLTDSMLQVIEESKRLADPAEGAEFQEVINTYQNAYRSIPPDQQAVLRQLAGPRGEELHGFFKAPQQSEFSFMQPKPSSTEPGLRAARATALDRRADEDEYLAGNFGSGVGLASARPYEATSRGRRQSTLLGNLIDDYGLDPEDVIDATVADAALPPFNPGEGVYLTRESFPTDERLSSYIGGDAANTFRFDDRIDDARVGRELLDQFYAIRDREGDPRLPSILGGLSDRIENANPDTLRAGTGAFDRFPGESDRLAALQMRPEIDKIQEELFARAFGFSGVSDQMDMLGATRRLDDMARVEEPLNLDRLAPWWRGTTQQTADGRLLNAPMTAEQITDTLISQSGILAEQPYLRESLRGQLLPQVEQAMAAASATPESPRASRAAGRQYRRNAAGMDLLRDEGYVPPQPQPQPSVGGESMQSIIERLRSTQRSPTDNDLGFANPPLLPRMAAQMMPNRMLASLLT